MLKSKKNIVPFANIIFYALLFIICSVSKSQVKSVDTLLAVYRPDHISLFNNLQDDKSPTEEAEQTEEKFLIQSNFSGNWWGIRNNLAQVGLDFQFVYKGESFSNLSGGIKNGNTSLDNIDLILSADLSKSLGIESANLLVQFLGNSGGSPSEYIGCLQGISNIETESTWKLYQLLLEKKFFNESFAVAFGLYDFNSEFDTRESSSIFINPSHGIGPDISQSGLNGPSIFPTTSLALRFKYEFENGNYLQTALFDGVPGDPENPYGTQILLDKNDGLLLAGEFGLVSKEDDELESKVALGVWTYTSSFEKNNFTAENENIVSLEKNFGIYLTAEKLLSSNYENPNKNLFGFVRLGYANNKINPVDFYFGTGIKITGLFSGRKEDALGIAIAYSHNSEQFINSAAFLDDLTIHPYEINFETTYMLHLTPWLIIQPDLQYVINPSFSTQTKNALVVGSRLQLVF